MFQGIIYSTTDEKAGTQPKLGFPQVMDKIEEMFRNTFDSI